MSDISTINFGQTSSQGESEHIIRATDEILAQIRLVKDADDIPVFQSAERIRVTRSSVLKTQTPYTHLMITDVKVTQSAQSGFGIIEEEAEIVLLLIFQSATRVDDAEVDIQERGFKLRRLVLKYLQESNPSNPNGLDLTPRNGYVCFWRPSFNGDFRAKLDKTVTMIGSSKELSGDYYSIPIQFKIKVRPNVILP